MGAPGRAGWRGHDGRRHARQRSTPLALPARRPGNGSTVPLMGAGFSALGVPPQSPSVCISTWDLRGARVVYPLGTIPHCPWPPLCVQRYEPAEGRKHGPRARALPARGAPLCSALEQLLCRACCGPACASSAQTQLACGGSARLIRPIFPGRLSAICQVQSICRACRLCWSPWRRGLESRVPSLCSLNGVGPQTQFVLWKGGVGCSHIVGLWSTL